MGINLDGAFRRDFAAKIPLSNPHKNRLAARILQRKCPRSQLMIVTTAQLFKHAYGNYAVGAYNINNAEQAMGLFKGCLQSQAPFIIQISKGARKYTDKRMLEAIIRSADVIFPEAVFAVHLD